MDKKITIVVAVVLIIIVAAAAYVLLSNNNNERPAYETLQQDSSIDGATYKYGIYTGTARLQVYGNTNNDDYLNDDDLTLLKEIVDSGSWNRYLYPLADVNCDGSVNQDDVEHLEDLLNERDGTLMYYVNMNGYPDYVHYPITGNIGCTYDYGYMIAQTFGIWDRVVAGLDRWIDSSKVSNARYPGVYDFYNLGSDYEMESFLKAYDEVGMTLVTGAASSSQITLNNQFHTTEYRLDFINLSYASQRFSNITPITAVITAGVLLGCSDECMNYIEYFDSTIAEITNRISAAGVDTYSFIVPYNTSNAVTTDVDCIDTTGRCMGDYWIIMECLPCYDAWTPQSSNVARDVEIETLIATDPDLLFISMWGVMTDQTSAADAQASFEEKASYFAQTDAYKNGNVYGFAFETIGTYGGIGGMKLLCSYIWPDIFTEEEGWADLQYYYDTFTLYEGDVKNAGGLMVFKLS